MWSLQTLLEVQRKRACPDKESDLFRINKENDLPEEEWLGNHLENPGGIVENQNKESIAVWPSILSFCNTFCEDGANHIVEGVALLPSLVSQMKDKPAHIVYVGNTSPKHFKHMLEYGQKNPEQDWMAAMNYSEKRIEGMANFVRSMSLYFKLEAEKYGFPYYEISDDDFQGSIDKILNFMLK